MIQYCIDDGNLCTGRVTYLFQYITITTHSYGYKTRHDCFKFNLTANGWVYRCMFASITFFKMSPISLYKESFCHVSRQYNCWSFRCSWSIPCQRCSNYIFILDLTPDFIRLGKDKCKTRRETFKFGDLVRFILEILRYLFFSYKAFYTDVSWASWWSSTNQQLDCLAKSSILMSFCEEQP